MLSILYNQAISKKTLLLIFFALVNIKTLYSSGLNQAPIRGEGQEAISTEAFEGNLINTTGSDIPGQQVAHTYSLHSAITGYLVYLPEDYDSGKDYPLVLFLHGAGEVGTNINLIKRNGPPKMVDNGEKFPFILVSPQARYTWDHNGAAIDQFVEQMKKDYHIDDTRFYVTGLSMGGAATWNYTTDYDHKVAAAVPICGWGNPSRACEMKTVPVWAFHNQGDGTVGVGGTINMVNGLEACPANPMPKETIYPVSGHDAWTTTYNNDAMWDWMLSHSKGTAIAPPANEAPVASAGSDQYLTLPTNSISLYGSASDTDGSVSTYKWTKTAGPAATLTDASSATLKLSGLVEGNYTFKLSVSDNQGLTGFDEVKVSVNPGSTYNPSGSSVSINFTNNLKATSPWNNSASNPYVNKTISNLNDSDGKTTSISLTFLTSWGGAGTNSSASGALYPQNVAKSYYWTASPLKESLKLSGLDKNMKYSFVFFASRNGSGLRNTDYTIGNKTVTLDATNNSTNTVQISEVAPNSSGEVIIYVSRGANSTFGYINALVIRPSGSGDETTNVVNVSDEKLDLEHEGIENSLLVSGIAVNKASTGAAPSATSPTADVGLKSDSESISKVKVYPNPVINKISVALVSKKPQIVQAKLIDPSGTVLQNEAFLLVEGLQEINFQVGSHVKTGLLILTIEFENEQTIRQRIIKQ